MYLCMTELVRYVFIFTHKRNKIDIKNNFSLIIANHASFFILVGLGFEYFGFKSVSS